MKASLSLQIGDKRNCVVWDSREVLPKDVLDYATILAEWWKAILEDNGDAK